VDVKRGSGLFIGSVVKLRINFGSQVTAIAGLKAWLIAMTNYKAHLEELNNVD